MFMKRLRYDLTELKEVVLFPNYKIISSALIGTSIFFLQGLIVSTNIDTIQILAIICFSIAIPILSFYFLAAIFIPQQKKHAKVYAPAYLVSILSPLFSFGSILVCTGITFLLLNVSLIASLLFSCIGFCGLEYVIALRKHIIIMIDEEEKPE